MSLGAEKPPPAITHPPAQGRPRSFPSIRSLAAASGTRLGYRDWRGLDQDLIDRYAELTGDRQWIHVDPARAADGPYGATVAHGLLTLSLVPVLAYEVYRVESVRMAVNYGLNRVRFPAPAPAGVAIRAAVDLLSVTDQPDGAQVVNRVAVETAAGGKPCCVAETVVRLYC